MLPDNWQSFSLDVVYCSHRSTPRSTTPVSEDSPRLQDLQHHSTHIHEYKYNNFLAGLIRVPVK